MTTWVGNDANKVSLHVAFIWAGHFWLSQASNALPSLYCKWIEVISLRHCDFSDDNTIRHFWCWLLDRLPAFRLKQLFRVIYFSWAASCQYLMSLFISLQHGSTFIIPTFLSRHCSHAKTFHMGNGSFWKTDTIFGEIFILSKWLPISSLQLNALCLTPASISFDVLTAFTYRQNGEISPWWLIDIHDSTGSPDSPIYMSRRKWWRAMYNECYITYRRGGAYRPDDMTIKPSGRILTCRLLHCWHDAISIAKFD